MKPHPKADPTWYYKGQTHRIGLHRDAESIYVTNKVRLRPHKYLTGRLILVGTSLTTIDLGKLRYGITCVVEKLDHAEAIQYEKE